MIRDSMDFIRAQTQILSPSLLPEIKLHLATEVTPLWKMTEERLKQVDLPPPFWAFAWPGGQGMARYVFDFPETVEGKRVLDFAAGSGVAAIAAMMAGAKKVLAVDIDPLAIAAIKLNAALNNVAVETGSGLDLSKPFLKTDVIFAGDIFYQQSVSASVTRWLRLCVDAGKTVYVSDPGRAYVPQEGLRELAAYDVPTSRDLEDQDLRKATVRLMDKNWTPPENEN